MKKLILTVILFALVLSARAQVSAYWGDGNSGYLDDVTADSVSCRFTLPYGCAYDTRGNIWITDQGNNYVGLINSGKYHLREGNNVGGFYDGTSLGQYGGVTYAPSGIIVVPGKAPTSDQIYLCDAGNNAIRKIDSFVNITLSQKMSTVAGGGTKVNGVPGQSGYVNGTGANSLFSSPMGIEYINDANGGYLVVADLGNNAVRKVSLHKSDYGTTSDLATGIQNPNGIFVDSLNNIFVASSSAGIVEISNTGKVATFIDGSKFDAPTSLVIRGTDMYIADGCHIAYFDMTQQTSVTNPTILTGDPADTTCDFKDGSYADALFNGINSLTLSPDKTFIIVADAQNDRFRKVILPPAHNSGFNQTKASKNTFNVYPNPASGYIFINNKLSANADIALYTMTGKQVLNENNVMLNAGQPYSLDIENQPTGVYVLQITTNSGTYNNKIILR